MALADTQSNMDARVGARAWYTLIVLTTIMCLNNMDRYVLAILVQPIKADLSLSDTQIGLLTGFAFSAFYAIFTLPIARISDRGHRYRVIWMSMGIWSVVVALCGAVQSFWQMLVLRFTLGAGEAGSSPASQSIISDLFPIRRRHLALSIFMAGGTTGVMLAFSLGGWLEQHVGWRMTFVFAALVSLPILLLFLLTVKDPRGRRPQMSEVPNRGSIFDLWSNRILVNVCVATGLLAFPMLGLPQWLPAFLERSHDLTRVQIGATLAATHTLGLMIGLISGGLLADRLGKINMVWPSRILVIASSLALIPFYAAFMLEDTRLVFAMLALGAFFISMPAGISNATCQTVVRTDQRASAASCIIIGSAFLGLGLLPFLTGVLSDLLEAEFGRHSLRWAAFTILVATGPLTSILYYRAMTMIRARVAETGQIEPIGT